LAENPSDAAQAGPDPERIKLLCEIMTEHDLSRLEWSSGEARIVLRRGFAPLSAPQPMAFAPPAALPEAAVEPSAAPASDEIVIRSPMVGTFYTAPDPESPPFASVGDTVGPERVVCLIEAMKVFNEIKAETSGRIVRVLVKNAEAVEFDQPLFALAPA
jgi:acetyl-CoA carboxylase biotin carboxyl carrier protein